MLRSPLYEVSAFDKSNCGAAALELRKLLAHAEIDTLLVGDGHSIFGNGRERLLACLVARDDIWLTW